MLREKPMTSSANFVRHVISINDLSNEEIEKIFSVGESYLERLRDKRITHKIGKGSQIADGKILAALFYEPSTRTRLSFESAMLRLGGKVITSADPDTSSAAKGESLADSVRVVANYADIIVLRHPRDGAARLAAEYSPIPVINGGDGSHEHPTQTLCDIFTLKKKNKKLKNLAVAISGDLRGSRTIHSFVYALARFGAHIVPMPAPGMELPAHVDRRLRDEFNCTFHTGDGSIGALYHTPDEPHQPALFPSAEFKIAIRHDKISAVYVTRFQKERWEEKEGTKYPRIDAKFLRDSKYSHASVMHPLPRVGELDASFDSDLRAVYFEQAAYGVPVRMALIALLLGLSKEHEISEYEGGFQKSKLPIYDHAVTEGIRCINSNCIVHDEKERPYVRNKFQVVKNKQNDECKLRCFYCESDANHFVVANKKNKWYTEDTSVLVHASDQHFKDFIVFAESTDALNKGYHLKRSTPSTSTEPALQRPKHFTKQL